MHIKKELELERKTHHLTTRDHRKVELKRKIKIHTILTNHDQSVSQSPKLSAATLDPTISRIWHKLQQIIRALLTLQ